MYPCTHPDNFESVWVNSANEMNISLQSKCLYRGLGFMDNNRGSIKNIAHSSDFYVNLKFIFKV